MKDGFYRFAAPKLNALVAFLLSIVSMHLLFRKCGLSAFNDDLTVERAWVVFGLTPFFAFWYPHCRIILVLG